MTDVIKESREELVKSDEFQKRLIRNSFDGIVATDAKGIVTIFNRVAETLTGRSRDELIGREHWSTLFQEQLGRSMDLPLSHERIRRVRGFRPRESVIRHADGGLVDVRLAGISLYERGIHVGKVFFFEDMREIKQLRGELIRSERLAATGQAAASISHSIRNILDGLRGGVYVFKQGQELGIGSKMETGWEMIERNVETISSLVKDLLNFAKPRKPDYRELDPASLIQRLLAQLGLDEDERVTLRTEIGPPGMKVLLDPDAFEQCLANLIRNAVESIPEDRTGLVTVAFRMEGDRAIFTVSDDGVGMSSDTIEKVKGGMYSTKGSRGTGLGLLVIQKVVGEHNGSLDIESEQGRGSTFTINIPAAGERPAA
jgi:PAS domain S-box-containing protein